MIARRFRAEFADGFWAVPAGSSAQSPVVLYLALPHVLFRPVVEALGSCELPEGIRIVRVLKIALSAPLPMSIAHEATFFWNPESLSRSWAFSSSLYSLMNFVAPGFLTGHAVSRGR